MKNILLLVAIGILSYGCGAGKATLAADKTPVITRIDLVNVLEDKVKVTLDPGAFSSDEITYFIPETVPGTYSIDNYGQYIEGLQAFDYEGNQMAVSALGANSWSIGNSRELDKISYYVNDTYDTENSVKDAVFSPAGTNIDSGETFMLNLHGFVGYFGGYEEVPYEVQVQVPASLKATTSLPRKNGNDKPVGTDIFVANRYFEVIDNPILYAKPNTESFQLNDIRVTLSIYSPNGVYKASDLKDRMQKMMSAQKAFLGDIDGTKEYNILLHLSALEESDPTGFGALEHHSSTVVVLPEQMPKENLEQAMVDVVSHEFFHIVTPLNVHSKEVHFFDYNEPKMSRHLWMYEGTTEYFANLFQIQQGLIDATDFYRRIMDKIQASRAYDDAMSFTVMSENILKDPYKGNYANVYEKGALINMALDIRLRELSMGEKGVLWLMKALSETYDKDTPFNDDVLIDEIVALTYPEIRTFFETHVIGDTPINYEEYLAKVGLTTIMTEEESGYFLKDNEPYIDVDTEEDNAIFIRKGIELNSFFRNLGARGGDVIKSINDMTINLEAIRPIIRESFGWGPEKEITMVVLRDDRELTLEGAVGTPTIEVERIVPMNTVSDKQARLRDAWLKG
jgi:predicted metalloprotease with PDZ domain